MCCGSQIRNLSLWIRIALGLSVIQGSQTCISLEDIQLFLGVMNNRN